MNFNFSDVMKKWYIFLSICLLTITATAQTKQDSTYLSLNQLPDAGYFLPAPPMVGSRAYMDDILQWQWGKSQRPTARGKKASDESMWTPDIMRIIMAEVLGLDTISDEKTPALSRMLVRAYYTGNNSTKRAKEKYMRTRPFVQMGEETWAAYDSDYLRGNGSYPSGHTGFGMTTALIFAEMWPELQDTILRRGFEFGENRIITGAHYQSDVNAGYMCAAAAVARCHANPLYAKDLAEARAEYARLKGKPAGYDPAAKVEFPHGEKILNEKVDTASYRFLGDLMNYWEAEDLRDTPRGKRAVRDANTSMDYLADIFGKAMQQTISKEQTPATWELIEYVKAYSNKTIHHIKKLTFRKRPFVQLDERTPVPEKEESYRKYTSYPSGHTSLGWSLALTLAEVDIAHQDEILKTGYEYGYSRVIVGYHWATDVHAARILASGMMARLHSDETFLKLVKRAQAEK